LRRNHRGGRLPRIRERPLIVEKRLVLVEEVPAELQAAGRDRSARILYFPQSAGHAVRSSGPMTRSWPRG